MAEPVTFLLRPESFTLWVKQASDSVLVWQNTQGQASGLIDGMGKLVDRIYMAAKLPPNSMATAVYSEL
ncbi:MAG: hypothetical protein CSA11_11210 [Chloroflexi bacterium]|nr:MAG: hypothetical protein CSA11_11210 [Chloroflexota bacterium]